MVANYQLSNMYLLKAMIFVLIDIITEGNKDLNYTQLVMEC